MKTIPGLVDYDHSFLRDTVERLIGRETSVADQGV